MIVYRINMQTFERQKKEDKNGQKWTKMDNDDQEKDKNRGYKVKKLV